MTLISIYIGYKIRPCECCGKDVDSDPFTSASFGFDASYFLEKN